ncbi:hypothetical protein CR513_01979, partial [Mucuna pruriens]
MHAETISAKEDQEQAKVESISDNKSENRIPSGSNFKVKQRAKSNSNSTRTNSIKRSQPQQPKAEIMSAHLVSSSTQEQEDKLLKVLSQHKKAIGWTLSDLPGINPSICMHRILMEEVTKPIRQQQRRMNPTILDMVKKEFTKLLVVGIIYPISDSQWMSLVQVVPKKFEITVMKNQHDELVPMQIQNSWRVCINYRRLNEATRKDHFPLPFVDQVLEKLSGKSHCYFLDGLFGYMQIHIAPED